MDDTYEMNGNVKESFLEKIDSPRKNIKFISNVLCVMWLERNEWKKTKHRCLYHLDQTNIATVFCQDNIKSLFKVLQCYRIALQAVSSSDDNARYNEKFSEAIARRVSVILYICHVLIFILIS